MSTTLKVDAHHHSKCDALIADLCALYHKGKDAFYGAFAKHLPDLKELYNYRGDYEREHQQRLPPHALDTVGYLYSTRAKLPNKQWEVDWDAMGRALASKRDATASVRGGHHEDEVEDMPQEAGASKVKGKGKEKEKDKETGKAQEKEKKARQEKELAPGGSGKLAKKDQPRPKPIRREGGEGSTNVHRGAGMQDTEQAAAAKGPAKTKPSVNTAAAAGPASQTPATTTKKTAAKPRVIKSKERVGDSEEEEVAPVKGKFREKADEEEEAARERAQRPGKKVEKVAPRASGGGARTRGPPPPTSDTRGGGLADDEGDSEEKEEAPLHTVRRRQSDRREADAAKRAEEEKEEEGKRVFMVFAKCSMCERLKIPCIWTHSRIHSAREGVKVACDFCKAQKRGCDASGSAALSLNGHLGPYEEELFPGEEPGKGVGGDGGEEQLQTRTLGDVFVTMLEEQRNLLFQVGRVAEKVSGLSSGIDTAPQHQEGLTKAIKKIMTHLEMYDDDRKAWDVEREEFEKERKGWQNEREAWAYERKEWEEERKKEAHKFAAAVTALAASIEGLKATPLPFMSPPLAHSGPRASLSPPLRPSVARGTRSPPLRDSLSRASSSPPPSRIPSRARLEDDEEEDTGSDDATSTFQRSRLSAIEEESIRGSQEDEGRVSGQVIEKTGPGSDKGDDAPPTSAAADMSSIGTQDKEGDTEGDQMDTSGNGEPRLGASDGQGNAEKEKDVGPGEDDEETGASIKVAPPTGSGSVTEPSDTIPTPTTEPKRRTRSHSKAQPPSGAAAAVPSRPPSAQPKKRKHQSSSPTPPPHDAAADPTAKPAKKMKT